MKQSTAELLITMGISRMHSPAARRRKRILVCRHGPSLLASAIQGALEEERELEISGLDVAGPDAPASFEAARPDIVVVVSYRDCLNFRPSLEEVFSAHPTATVVLVCGCDNKARIYRCHEAEVAGWEDLLLLLRAKRFPKAPASQPQSGEPTD